MRRHPYEVRDLFLLFSMLLCGATLLTGCATTGSTSSSMNSDDNPYAGGNGAFGEDPENPGHYASDHQMAKR